MTRTSDTMLNKVGLVLIYWLAELGPGVCLQGPGVLELVDFWQGGGGAVPDTVGNGVWGVLKLVLAC